MAYPAARYCSRVGRRRFISSGSVWNNWNGEAWSDEQCPGSGSWRDLLASSFYYKLDQYCMHALLCTALMIDKQPRAVKIGYCLTRDYSLHGTCSYNPDNPTPPPRSKPVPTLVCSAIEHPGAPRHWGTGAPTRWLVSFIGFQRAATPHTVTFPSPSFV